MSLEDGIRQMNKRNKIPVIAPSNNSFNRSGISLHVIENLDASLNISRPVNSSVRFLLNDRDRSFESIVLNLEGLRSSRVKMWLECSEPAPASSVDDNQR
jgi:hypothetical protein